MKICGLTRRADALGADALGADFLGVILSAGFGRSVEPARASAMLHGVGAVPVAVLVDETPERAVELARSLGAGVVQLHGHEPPEDAARIRELGDWRVWKAVRAASTADVEEAVGRYGGVVDGLLVEGRREGVLGGGGARLDPERVPGLRELVPGGLELILAGGLTPDTVARAVDRYGPDVVDVSSGVEAAPGEKSPDLLRRFIEEARAAARRAPDPNPVEQERDRRAGP